MGAGIPGMVTEDLAVGPQDETPGFNPGDVTPSPVPLTIPGVHRCPGRAGPGPRQPQREPREGQRWPPRGPPSRARGTPPETRPQQVPGDPPGMGKTVGIGAGMGMGERLEWIWDGMGNGGKPGLDFGRDWEWGKTQTGIGVEFKMRKSSDWI